MARVNAAENSGTDSRKRDALKRAEQWMTKGGIIRDDSDDELGHEDLPWEWIYETESGENGKLETIPEEPENTPKSARRRSSRQTRQRIVGARMGTFVCKIGEVILLKSPEPGKNWVGIITEFLEEEDEEDQEIIKYANIMWFASPDEFISTRNKRRMDALPNEQYLTTDFNVNPLASINGKAQVMSKDAFFSRYPDGAPPKSKQELAEYNKCIVCRRGVNQLQGRYTEEFVWEHVYSPEQLHDLIDLVKDGLKAAKKRKQADTDVSIIASGTVT
jgi:origin recognition complex subunit 1